MGTAVEQAFIRFVCQMQSELTKRSRTVPKDVTVRRPTKAKRRADMMEQMLDAAEDLFSKHGLYGVTLQDVAKRIRVHHTLVNYYFKDKKKLFDTVFARRAV